MAVRRKAKPIVQPRKRRPSLGPKKSGSNALEKELAEARAQQAATDAILRIIASSSSDVQPVFDAIAHSAMRLIGAFSAAVVRVEGDQAHLLSLTSTSKAGDEAVRRSYPRPIGHGPLAKAVSSRAPAVREDIETDPGITPRILEMARARGYRSLLAVPMLRDGTAIGAIMVTRREAGPFSAYQTALLRTFADQAVIAIENARLFNETREALERQTATAEILKVIASSPSDVQPVFDVIADSAMSLFRGQSAAVTRLAGDMLQLAAMTSTSEEGNELLRKSFPRPLSSPSLTSTVVRSGKPAYQSDIESDPTVSPELKARGHARGMRSYLIVPMLRDGKAIGTISVTRAESGKFTPHQFNLLETFADQAVIAIENVRLFNETRALQEERTARLKSFFSPQLGELLAAGKGEDLLKTHRREITVQFFDLRGFTAFTGAAEPEEVMELLREFHGALGKLVMENEGTIERFAGDSVMIFFNDPLPVERPAERAVQSALAMMRAFDPIAALWKKRGHDLGLGAGIAQGYATLGAIGFEGRRDYAAIGPVTNLAARLCAEAKSGQILTDVKTGAALEGAFEFDAVGPFNLKGFAQPVPAFALRRGN